MLISYVVRLRADALAEGRFVGEIEAVTSKERGPFVTVDQITDFVMDTMSLQVLEAGAGRALDDLEPENEP